MSAEDMALRNTTVHVQKAQKFCVLAISSSEKQWNVCERAKKLPQQKEFR